MVGSVIRFVVAGLLMEAGAAYAMGGDNPWLQMQGSNYSLENFGLRSYFLGDRSDYLDIAPSFGGADQAIEMHLAETRQIGR